MTCVGRVNSNRVVKMLAFISRGFEHKSEEVMLQLTLVRLLMAFCVLFQLIQYRKDMGMLERVQTRFNRMLPRLRILAMMRVWTNLDYFHWSVGG